MNKSRTGTHARTHARRSCIVLVRMAPDTWQMAGRSDHVIPWAVVGSIGLLSVDALTHPTRSVGELLGQDKSQYSAHYRNRICAIPVAIAIQRLYSMDPGYPPISIPRQPCPAQRFYHRKRTNERTERTQAGKKKMEVPIPAAPVARRERYLAKCTARVTPLTGK